jgi:hypothetical protein
LSSQRSVSRRINIGGIRLLRLAPLLLPELHECRRNEPNDETIQSDAEHCECGSELIASGHLTSRNAPISAMTPTPAGTNRSPM